MSTRPPFEERHALPKNELDYNLQKKHALELEISKREQIKISLEKRARIATTKNASVHC